jgi:type VI secretion system secreted protein Hcp
MPQVAYITITGSKQGLITAGCNTPESVGNKYQQDHTDESTVIQFNHELMIPRDPQTGQPTGQRVHKPLCFKKRYDKASPLLFQALCSGERLTEVEVKWYRTTMDGTQEHYFTHTLTDALLINIEGDMTLATDVSLDYRDHEETLCMTYRKIVWKHVVAGTEGSDDWRAPKT